MADPGAEPPENQGFKRRGGWQPPTGSDLPPGPVEPHPAGADSQGPGPPEGDRPKSVLDNSVAGQARDVAVGSMSGPGGTESVVTFRLEQYDPHAGRTGLVTVRMVGNTAMGFATEGDWVEVNGKRKGGFLNVQSAFNHTSGAQFSRRFGCLGAGMVIVVLSGILFILMIALIADLGSTLMFGALSAWRP
jgi:hypothetical protein